MDVIERKAERNAAIFAAWLDGTSFAEIGREHDITRQRAGQLVRIEAKRQLAEAVEALSEAVGVLTDPERADRAARNRAVAILEAYSDAPGRQ